MSANAPALVAQLVALGIEASLAEAAVAATGGTNIDAAMEVLFSSDAGAAAGSLTVAADARYKMTVVVNMALGMSAGKIASQCCHACLGCTRAAAQTRPQEVQAWEAQGEPIVVLQVKSLPELLALQQSGDAAGLVTQAIADAGRTEVCGCVRARVCVCVMERRVPKVCTRARSAWRCCTQPNVHVCVCMCVYVCMYVCLCVCVVVVGVWAQRISTHHSSPLNPWCGCR